MRESTPRRSRSDPMATIASSSARASGGSSRSIKSPPTATLRLYVIASGNYPRVAVRTIGPGTLDLSANESESA